MIWNFRQGGKTDNPKDAGIKEFSKDIFESVMREATQNAIDNRLDENQPISISFNFGIIDKSLVPGFDELEQRWEAVYEKWKDQEQYEVFLNNILQRIKDFRQEVPYLSISDFNTKGMNFTSNQDMDKTGYGAFSRGNHSFHESDNAAGSEGQGKAALYAISAVRTMFVHTISEKGSIYEGLTRFATHEYQGKKCNADGYYPHEPEKPNYEINSQNNLPFRRGNSELGTTITLVGLWPHEEAESKMIKAAINNFWMAIQEGDLIVKVGAEELNQKNIDSMVDKYLPERSESSHTKSNPTKYGRTKCYYETWIEKHKDDTEIYKEKINILGNCILKISQHHEYPGKIAFFREQKMLIRKSLTNAYISKGYCGVFICIDKEGNKILRKMEGKTHTEWDPKLCMTDSDRSKGEEAIKALNTFINASWKDYRSKHFPDTLDLKGLAGVSIGSKPSREKKQSATKEKNTGIPPTNPKKQNEFEKNGIYKKGLSSLKENNNWKYTLLIKANDNHNLNIRMFPATDAVRVSNDDYLEVMQVSNGWTVNVNSIEGEVKKGDNIIEFILNEPERVALDFKITIL